METGSFEKLAGEVEADESYVGGKGINMHKSRKAKFDGARGIAVNKTAVMGMKQRDGRVIAHVVPDTKRHTIHENIHEHVEQGSTLYTDKLLSYLGLEGPYDHKVIDHIKGYVDGKISTNQIENFWALMKRALKGTYVSVQPEHLQRYVTEEVYRFNARHDVDGGRFLSVLAQTEGKRLTYAELTEKA
jgi:transposase-like protein